MLTSGATTALLSTRAVGSIPAIMLSVRDHGAELGLGRQFTRDARFTAEPPHVAFMARLTDVIFERVAGSRGLAEFRLVDGQKENRFLARPGRPRHDADHT